MMSPEAVTSKGQREPTWKLNFSHAPAKYMSRKNLWLPQVTCLSLV